MAAIHDDYLNREEKINDIINIIKSCANLDKSITFSLEGEWGKGKSWILEKIEAKIKGIDVERQYSNKELLNKVSTEYMIIRYNAWEKDYYNEPLIAILATIVKQINSMLSVERGINETIKDILKQSLSTLAGLLGNLSKKIIGVDVVGLGKKAAKIANNISEKGEIALVQDEFNHVDTDIEMVIQTLDEISEKMPIIFIVDELDRCIPDYAIKNLERLHHVFDKISKSVTIISIYRKQLNESIIKMFGNKDNASKYLEKFIDFNISLDDGQIDVDSYSTKLAYLRSKFSNDVISEENVAYIKEQLVSTINNPRDLERIYDNTVICHDVSAIDTSKLPIECMIGELLASAHKFTIKNESARSGMFAVVPSTRFGSFIKKYFQPTNNIGIYWFKHNDSDSIIRYTFCVINNNAQNWSVDIGDKTSENLKVKIDSEYKDFNKYYKLIKN